MAIKLLSQYTLGDMEARYLLDEESGLAGFMLLPYGTKLVEKENKDVKLESLVQLKIIGDIYNSTYAMGASMRNSETVQGMKYKEQKSSDTEDEIMIDTILCDDRGYQVIHHLRWKKVCHMSISIVHLKIWEINTVHLKCLRVFLLGNYLHILKVMAQNVCIYIELGVYGVRKADMKFYQSRICSLNQHGIPMQYVVNGLDK